MSIKSKTKTLLTVSNVTPRQLAPALGTAEQTAVNRISIGITKIEDLVKIVDFCGASIAITTKDGTVIPLTLEDLEGGK